MMLKDELFRSNKELKIKTTKDDHKLGKAISPKHQTAIYSSENIPSLSNSQLSHSGININEIDIIK